jgi:hypothetical protein
VSALRPLLPLLGLLAALLLPASAPAAEPGLNVAGGAGTAADFDQLSDLGAKWARHGLSWDTAAESNLVAYQRTFQEEDRRGVKSLLMVSSASTTPPADPEAYATFVARLASRYKGSLEAIEIWNEPDEGMFWRGGPQVDRYVELLQRSYTAIKAVNPQMTVVFGPLTGANYGFLDRAYDAGAKGYFDALAAHTDTACLVDPPTRFYRDQGRIARFTFLGYRELRATMLAHGDDKPIWLTEIGWSAARHGCQRGVWAGQKLAGVTEDEQAQNLREAYHCLEQDRYVQVAMWFNSRDQTTDGQELNMYGLLRADGSRRPAYGAFQDFARFGDRLTTPCGDFGAPTVQILAPRTSAVIGNADPLTIRATSPDRDVLRMTFAIKGAPAEIRNFTNKGQPLDLSRGVGMDWQGAKKLPYGTHTLVVTAVDAQGNAGTAEVSFRKVNPATLGPQKTAFPKLRLLGSGRKRTLAGQLRAKMPFSLPGKVLVEWHNKRGARWKKVHGAAWNANKAFRFTQRLRYSGRWRVRVRYVGKRPFRNTASRWISFRVR